MECVAFSVRSYSRSNLVAPQVGFFVYLHCFMLQLAAHSPATREVGPTSFPNSLRTFPAPNRSDLDNPIFRNLSVVGALSLGLNA